MGWDAVISGELRFAAGGVERWRDLVLDAPPRRKWPGLLGHGPEAEDATVADALARLGREQAALRKRSGPELLDLTAGPGRLELRGWLGEDEYRRLAGTLESLIRSASRVGAEGHYTVLVAEDLTGQRLRVSGGKVR